MLTHSILWMGMALVTEYITETYYCIAGYFCEELIFTFFVRQNYLMKINFHENF